MKTIWTGVGRLLLFYYAIIAVFSVINTGIYPYRLLLVSTFRGDWDGVLNIYWFVEAFAWCTVFSSLVYWVFARTARPSRLNAFGPLLFLLALAIRFYGGLVLDAEANAMRSPDQMLLFFAAGVILANGGAALNLVAAIVTTALTAKNWGMGESHWMIMGGAFLLISFKRPILLPRPVRAAMVAIGRASFYIYVLSVIPMYLTDVILHERHGHFWLLHVGLSYGLGLGAVYALSYASRRTESGSLWGAAVGDLFRRSPSVSN